MVAGPLPQQLAGRPRVGDLVGGDARIRVGRDIADAIARGLDGVHLDIGQLVENVGHVLQLRPVELDVLARGEMAVAAIVFLGDVGELAHLLRRQRAVGNRHAQHIGVKLEIEAVHQAERLELLFVQRARKAALDLTAELGDPFADELMIERVIMIHAVPPGCRPEHRLAYGA